MVDRRLALDLDLFSRGGLRVLDKIEQQDYDVLARASGHFEGRARRTAAGARWRAWRFRGRPDERDRTILRILPRAWRARRAKNFYYSFVLLSAPAAQRHVRHLRVHALLRRPERRAGSQPRPPSTAGAANWKRRSQGRFSEHPGLAGVSPHGAPLRHPARVFPRDDRRRGFRSGAAPLRDVRRSSTATATRWRRWWG